MFFFPPFSQRSGTRRRYHDDGISDDEIEGKRTFDLEEKVYSDRFGSDRIKRMEGKGMSYLHSFAFVLRSAYIPVSSGLVGDGQKFFSFQIILMLECVYLLLPHTTPKHLSLFLWVRSVVSHIFYQLTPIISVL